MPDNELSKRMIEYQDGDDHAWPPETRVAILPKEGDKCLGIDGVERLYEPPKEKGSDS